AGKARAGLARLSIRKSGSRPCRAGSRRTSGPDGPARCRRDFPRLRARLSRSARAGLAPASSETVGLGRRLRGKGAGFRENEAGSLRSELVVHTDLEGVQLGLDNAKTRIGLFAEVHVQIFGLGGDVAGDRGFETAADRPAALQIA